MYRFRPACHRDRLLFPLYRRHRTLFFYTLAVTHASLTDEYFNITNSSSNNNYYNLELNITIRNPNKYFGINYDKGQIVADYHNTSALANIADFQQPPKNMTLLTPSFKLQRDTNITDDAAWSGKGNHYDILIRLYFPKTFKTVTWWRRDSESCSLMFTCDLKQVTLQNGSQSVTTAFNSTKCQSRYTYSYFC
ncbi:hypothetical protein ACLB2K_044672 [Fragaria x ananassa]